MLNWDPGNAAAAGETLIRMATISCRRTESAIVIAKTQSRNRRREYEWAADGTRGHRLGGTISALKRDGYHFAVSLETHWRGAGTAGGIYAAELGGYERGVAKSRGAVIKLGFGFGLIGQEDGYDEQHAT